MHWFASVGDDISYYDTFQPSRVLLESLLLFIYLPNTRVFERHEVVLPKANDQSNNKENYYMSNFMLFSILSSYSNH